MEDLGIVESYLKRIKEKTSLKEGSNILEITTPFLDNSNDHIQLYLKKSENGGYILMDD
jgi:hypothetical protein